MAGRAPRTAPAIMAAAKSAMMQQRGAVAVPAAEVRVVVGDLRGRPDLDLDDRRKGGQEQADHARRGGREKAQTERFRARE